MENAHGGDIDNHVDEQSNGGSQMRFSVLGPLTLELGGEKIGLGGAKQQMVLALLLMEANSVVSVDRLLEWVWPESEGGKGSPSTLQVYVSNLRRLLAATDSETGSTPISTQRPGYRISLADSELDLLQFRSLERRAAEASRRGHREEVAARLREALALWKGDCLSGLPSDPSNFGVIAGINQSKVSVRERLAEVELDLGRHREILGDLHAWISADPLDERLRGHLMVAMYRCGRQADALACYQQGRELLVDELGIDPSRELRTLERRILDQDPALDFSDPLVDFDGQEGSAGHVRSAGPNVDLFVAAETTQIRGSVIRSSAHLDLNGHSVAVDGAVTTLGRMSDRDIAIEDSGVSRRHAEIRRVGDTYRIVDVGSSNGTLVNDKRVGEAQLHDGDRIRLGDTTLVFRQKPG